MRRVKIIALFLLLAALSFMALAPMISVAATVVPSHSAPNTTLQPTPKATQPPHTTAPSSVAPTASVALSASISGIHLKDGGSSGVNITNDQFTSAFDGWTQVGACTSFTRDTNSSNGPYIPSAKISNVGGCQNGNIEMRKTINLTNTYPGEMYMSLDYDAGSQGYYASTALEMWLYDGISGTPITSYWIVGWVQGDTGWENFTTPNLSGALEGRQSVTISFGFPSNSYGTQYAWIDNVQLYYPESSATIPIALNTNSSASFDFVAIDGIPVQTPYTISLTPGTSHTINAKSPVADSGEMYTFQSWSDNGTQSHTIIVPNSTTTYTANFTSQAETDVVYDKFASNMSGWGYGGWNYGYYCTGTADYDGSDGQPTPLLTGSTNGSLLFQPADAYCGMAAVRRNVTLSSIYPSHMYVSFNYRVTSSSGGHTYLYYSIYDANLNQELYSGAYSDLYTGGYDTNSNGKTWRTFTMDMANYVSGHPEVTFVFTIGGDWGNTEKMWIDNFHIFYQSAGLTHVSVTSSTTGWWFVTVDGLSEQTPYSVYWSQGSSHSVAASTAVADSGEMYAFSSWSDNGAQSHTITVPNVTTTYTASFTPQSSTDVDYDQFQSSTNGWTVGTYDRPYNYFCDGDLAYTTTQGQPTPLTTPSNSSLDFSPNGSCQLEATKTMDLNDSFPSHLYLTFNYRVFSRAPAGWTAFSLLVYDSNLNQPLYGEWGNLYQGGSIDTNQYGDVWKSYSVDLASYVNGHSTIKIFFQLSGSIYGQGAWLDNVHLFYSTPSVVPVTITSSTTGMWIAVVDGLTVRTPYTVYWTKGSQHQISAEPVFSDSGQMYTFSSWNDNETRSRTITVPTSPITYTATFTQQAATDVIYDQFTSSQDGWDYSVYNLPVFPHCGGTVSRDMTQGQPTTFGSANSESLQLSAASTYCDVVAGREVDLNNTFPQHLYLTFNYRATSGTTWYSNTNLELYVYDTNRDQPLFSNQIVYGGTFDTNQYEDTWQTATFDIASYVNGHPNIEVFFVMQNNGQGPTANVDNVHMFYATSSIVQYVVTSTPNTGNWIAKVDGFSVQTPYTVYWTPYTLHTLSANSYTYDGKMYNFQSWSDWGEETHVINATLTSSTYTASFTHDPEVDITYDQFADLNGWIYGTHPGATQCSGGLSLNSTAGQPTMLNNSQAEPSAQLIAPSGYYLWCNAGMEKTLSLSGWNPSQSLYISMNYRAYSATQEAGSANLEMYIYDGSNMLNSTTLYSASLDGVQYGDVWQVLTPMDISQYARGHSSITIYIEVQDYYMNSHTQAWIDNFHLFYATPTVSMTITSSPFGSGYVTVDGNATTTPLVTDFIVGSTHNITAQPIVSGGTGIRYLFTSWSDGGAINHTITIPNVTATYTAYYQLQYMLTMLNSPENLSTTSPAAGTYWYNASQIIPISAATNSSYHLYSWIGVGSGSYTYTCVYDDCNYGTSHNPTSIIMHGPITETATFSVAITVNSVPSGWGIVVVDGSAVVAPDTFYYLVGSMHVLAAVNGSCGTGCWNAFSYWSDGGAWEHPINVTRTPASYTVTTHRQYLLTLYATGGGTVLPACHVFTMFCYVPRSSLTWQNDSGSVQIQAIPDNGYAFTGWTGHGPGSYTGLNSTATVTMGWALTENATFTYTGWTSSASVQSSTGRGQVTFQTASGVIGNLSAISEGSLPTSGKPANMTFTYGFFRFTVTGLTPGASDVVTVTFPANMSANTQYWKYSSLTGWVNMTSHTGRGGSRVLTLTLTDGGAGDQDGLVNGVIIDDGGPGSPPSSTPIITGGSSNGNGTVIVTGPPPVITSIQIDPGTGANASAIDVDTYYLIKVNVTDPSQLTSLQRLEVRLYQNSSGWPGNLDLERRQAFAWSCLPLLSGTWYRLGSSGWTTPDGIYFDSGGSSIPTLAATSGVFTFRVKVPKVSHYTQNEGWYVVAWAEDKSAAEASRTNLFDIHLYVSLGIPSAIVWTAQAGSTNVNATDMPFVMNYTANAVVKLQVESTDPLNQYGDSFNATNLRISDTGDPYGPHSQSLTGSMADWKTGLGVGENETMDAYWFVSVPSNQPGGTYTFTYTMNVVFQSYAT